MQTDEPLANEDDGVRAAVLKRALRRFDETVLPQWPMRQQSLFARRFVSIPGAMWEGAWGEQFEKSIKVEVPKILRRLRKLENDYRQNRIVPDFRPAGGNSDNHSADTLDGLHRADSYRFKAQQARDNAYSEGIRGGMGAYRLKNELDDPLDKDSDAQVINPGLIITDADQKVFFDGNSVLYDKSDARFAFVINWWTPDAFKEEYGDERVTSWPDGAPRSVWDWYSPERVCVCEYYEVEEKREKLYLMSFPLTQETQRKWASELVDDELEDLKAQGWKVDQEQRRPRRRIHKYLMSGAEVLDDIGRIAGNQIPVVPYYCNRDFVDGIERFTGEVQSRMDAQRLYNGRVSKLAETDALSPAEKPIFAASQLPPALQALWGRMHIDRHAYALVEPLLDPTTGSIISAGPIGKIEAPQLPPVTAALLQIANTDLTEDDIDGADTVKANVSEEAMDIAAARVDAKSGVQLDNMRQTVQREGEIYLAMAGECYSEEGRKVDTMTEDGDDGVAVLGESFTDPTTGAHGTRNDFTGRFKVMASVTEATATRRDKTVRMGLKLAEIAGSVQDMEMAQAGVLTAVANMDGEGVDDLKAYARKKGVASGLFKPTEEEQAQIDKAAEAQGQQPDPMAEVATAQAQALTAQAAKDIATTGKIGADEQLSRAKIIQVLADAKAKGITADTAIADAITNAHRVRVDTHVAMNDTVGNDQATTAEAVA